MEPAMAKEHVGNPERLLGVKLQTIPGPAKRKRVVLAYVCYDTCAPRGVVAVKVAASESPSWTVVNGALAPRCPSIMRNISSQMT
jgi:hypothetical protein